MNYFIAMNNCETNIRLHKKNTPNFYLLLVDKMREKLKLLLVP